MEKEEINLEKPVRVGDYSITPIARYSLNYGQNDRGIYLICNKHPLAVVVIDGSMNKTFHLINHDISLGQLIKKVPRLKTLLEEMDGGS